MKKFLCALLAFVIALSLCTPSVLAKGDCALNINHDDISHQVSPTLYGVHINSSDFALDGGLGANLVSDYSFEYGDTKAHPCWLWDNLAQSTATTDSVSPNNPTYQVVSVDGKGTMLNLGYTEVFDYQTYNFNSKSAYNADMGFEAEPNTILAVL